MHIAALHIYPIKGARGISVPRVELEERGLRLDRRWMVVDESGLFCTQRELPELGTLRVLPTPSGLTIDDAFQVEYPSENAERLSCRVWKDEVFACTVSDEVDAWLSERLKKKVRLVQMDGQSVRSTPEGSAVSFADAYPILVVNTASLDDLRRRSGYQGLQMNCFRPNVVVKHDDAWSEDGWSELRIGEVRLRLVSPCERCKVTTLDPNDPHKAHPNGEPLRTLAGFRRQGKGVTFGWNAVVKRGLGAEIGVGDCVSSC